METYDVVLFLHIAAALFTFGVAAVMHVLLVRLRGMGEVRQLREQMPVLHAAGPLFPAGAVALFALGAWLVQLSDEKIAWGDGWVLTAIVALVVMEAVGGAIIARHSARLEEAVAAAPDGPVPAEIRALALDRGIWLGAHFSTAVALGIVFLMTVKPSGATSVVVVVVAALVGLASAVPFLRPAGAAAAAPA
jgi:hypothetical protein